MDEVLLTFDGRRAAFQPGQVVRIGRSKDNDVVVSDPAVSRQHALLTWGPDGWVFEGIGQGGTFLNGAPAARVTVHGAMEFCLASPQGPAVRVEPLAVAGGQAGPQPTAVLSAAGGPGGADGPGLADGSSGAGGPGPAGGPGEARAAPAGEPSAADDLGTALEILLPVRSWLTDPGLRRGLRLLVILYALLPLAFLGFFASSGNLATPGWVYSLYIAPLWMIAFWHLIRPGPVRSLEVQIGIGIIAWVVIWMELVTVQVNDHMASPGQSLSLPGAFVIGFNEEITKALPILVAALLLLKLRSVKLDVRMWMFLGTIAGLTFGVTEQATYTLLDIQGIASAQVNSQAVAAVLGFAERVFVDGLQHAVWAGVSAFFIGMAVNYPRRRMPLILLGVSIPAVLHALYDWSGSALNTVWLPAVVQAISLFLFLGYTMSAASIERRVRRTPMFRGESMVLDRFSETGDTGLR